ncbi:MAG: hypothetical protein JWQ02_1347, partial [Capsulimonas sp.]|nr:hypothetical protein [Capsulimonas sp.]
MTQSTLAIQTDHLRKVYGGSKPFVAV